MTVVANWSYPTAVRLGIGRSAELAEACADLGIRRPLLVTDRGLREQPFITLALQRLEAYGLLPAVFSDFSANPNEHDVRNGVQAFVDHANDGVIAFGGGSALDTGKAVAFMVGQVLPIWEFEDIGDWWKKAQTDRIAPVIAVPTTAGTGSEVGRAAVITNSATHEKKIIFHPRMLPALVIADPELSAAMPPAITAGTGIDAFAHCLEAYCSPAYHPMSRAIALEGMRLSKENLPVVYQNGTDLVARTHMCSAAMMGAVAFQKGLGAIHALSHPIGARYGFHHGTINAALMLPVLRFNRPVIEDKIRPLTGYLGIDGAFDGFLAFVSELITGLGLPKNLTELGMQHPDIDRLCASALADPSAAGNPAPLTPDTLRRLLETCF